MAPRNKQKDQLLLDFISGFTLKHGYPPTIQEMVEHLGYKSTGSIYSRLMRLERDGYISWKERSARTMKVLKHV